MCTLRAPRAPEKYLFLRTLNAAGVGMFIFLVFFFLALILSSGEGGGFALWLFGMLWDNQEMVGSGEYAFLDIETMTFVHDGFFVRDFSSFCSNL